MTAMVLLLTSCGVFWMRFVRPAPLLVLMVELKDDMLRAGDEERGIGEEEVEGRKEERGSIEVKQG